MSAGASIYALLTANQAVNTLLSGRIHPLIMPQGGPLPAATYAVISTVPTVCRAGDTGADEVRAQVSVFASTYAQTQTIAAAIRGALVGQSTATVKGIEILNATDLYEEDAKVFHAALTFQMQARTN
jgi:hypothetical protein